MEVLLVTGLSGAGKSLTLDILEDIGYYCVDNLPPRLAIQFATLCQESGNFNKIAIGVDVRGGAFFADILQVVEELARLFPLNIIFLEAEDAIIIRRYKESRRNHPLANPQESLHSSIAREREKLDGLRKHATYIIDTTELSGRQLKEKLQNYVQLNRSGKVMDLTLLSFGFKRGIPIDADLVFDVRFLPNPFYITKLRTQRGTDEEVAQFIWQSPVSQEYYAKVLDLLRYSLPYYEEEGKSRLVVAIGCTGGHHRSVAFVERLEQDLRDLSYPLSVQHRDVNEI